MDSRKPPILALALVAGLAFAFVAAALVLSGAVPYIGAPLGEDQYGPAEFAFEPASFDDLPGWGADDQAAALAPFVRSCARIAAAAAETPANPREALGRRAGLSSIAGVAGDWTEACDEARALLVATGEDAQTAPRMARAFFERRFSPVRIKAFRPPVEGGRARRAKTDVLGRFTGYFEPAYAAARAADALHPAPVLARPHDLVTIELGRFRESLAGQRLAGHVEGGELVPYPDHGAINDGALGDKARALAFLDPNDLLFLQIQGSGRLRFADGSEMRVGYDGQNGREYFPVGRALIEQGAIARDAMSMQAIRAWLASAPPDAAKALRERNPSYVFFRPLTLEDPALGPFGSEGVQLTPHRSLAVDRRYHAMGTPVWVALETDDGAPLRRLFIAQDSGGAISGPVRGDIFFGAGDEAAAAAGTLNAQGAMFALIPAPLAARIVRDGEE